LTRPGATLAELLVALTLAGLVLGTASRSVLQQQRTARRVAASTAAAAQSRGASDLIRSQLALAEPKAGDFSGDQSDTALQLRVPVALGAVCASSSAASVLTVDDTDDAPTGATLSPPRAGDSLWWRADGGGGWAGRRLSDASSADDDCPPLHTGHAPSLRIQLTTSDTLPLGAPVRITRQLRYVLYRGGDGLWQLGSRDWSEAMHRFAPPQPIAGPFVRHGPGDERTGFRFFDANDLELGADDRAFDATTVARVRLTLSSREVGAGPFVDGLRREQLEIAVRGNGPR
jgi:type II secretory pathway pseudopilin PulG